MPDDPGKLEPPGAPGDPLRAELSNFRRIIEALSAADVEFIVIGGQAEALFGSPRVTLDTDLTYRRTPENLERLAAVLRSLHPKLRDAPPDLRFVIELDSALTVFVAGRTMELVPRTAHIRFRSLRDG
jgi:hypothetical protein